MQVKVELINDFNTLNNTVVKNRVSPSMPIAQAEALYSFLEKILIKLQNKDRDYWKEKDKRPEKLFTLVLNELKQEYTSKISAENFDDIYQDDWHIGE